MRVTYNGSEALTFTDYLDLKTGRTLHAEPGGTYDIAPASGRVVPEVPEPWFTPAGPPALPPGDGDAGGETFQATAALEGEAASGTEPPEPDGESGTEEPSAF